MYSCSCSHRSYLLNRIFSNQLTDEDISINTACTAQPKSGRVPPTTCCTNYLKTPRPLNNRPPRRSFKMERKVFEKYDGGQVTAGSRPDTKQDHFRHSQLPGSRYIRLLRIIQGDTKSISISITLHTFPLDQLPEYEALSYTWGKAILADNEEDNNDPGMEYEIFVNSEPFIITENLYDGLSELRKDVRLSLDRCFVH
jgi:hypothetical protein